MTNAEILLNQDGVSIEELEGSDFFIESQVLKAMDTARKDEAISFSKFLSGFIECQAGWLKKFEHPDDKEKFYTIEQVYELFKNRK